MYYPEEVIEEVRMRSDIVDVISGYVKLQKKGSNLFGLCPFHHEKSPSFSVSPSKQMYHCFGCGVSGNVITFVMEYENYSFREAVEMLADRSGVKLPKMEYSKEAKAKADRKAALLEINKLAANYFYYQLKQPQGKIGYDYLVKRKLTDETIRRFGLGFSNKISDDLYRYLKSKGYEDELLKDTGLVTIEERGARDKFWNRVMFPIMDVNSRVIGFGGRVLGDGEPTYLNSPETMLFDQSRTLYGLHSAYFEKEIYDALRGLHGCDFHAPGGVYERGRIAGNGADRAACGASEAVYGSGHSDLRQRWRGRQSGAAGDSDPQAGRNFNQGIEYASV